MHLRACFLELAVRLAPDLVEGTLYRAKFEQHRARIEGLFASQPDVPMHQDSVAGFLYGFMTAEEQLVPAGGIALTEKIAVFGGTYLVAWQLPLGPAWSPAGRRFLARLAAQVDGQGGSSASSVPVVQEAFARAVDVPMTAASLGGFCLGVIYVAPYLGDSEADPLRLFAAACRLAGVTD